ncbi:MAG: lipopolysaccharide biosynthesis protein [Prevotella sp.]|nr:lipopolysaccharide biosynthesis protein [Prevotella sp.]
MDTLKEKTTKGLFWGGLNNVVQQGLGLVFGIVLGRLLSPHDYGMTAVILVFQLLATALQESGFKSAIANLRQPTDRDYNSVFWFNILVGMGCYVVLFLCAPLIARYYHTPALTPLCRYAFLTIIFASLGTAQSAYLFRNLRVKEQAEASMTATLLSSITGVVMAWCGFGYWALATQSVLYVALNTAQLWYYSHWRPTLHIDFGPVRRMFRFSCKLLATTILDRINMNIMNVLLGRYFTTVEVGNYNQAYMWSSKASYMVQGTTNQVVQPVLTNVADERERQLRIFRKLVRFTAFVCFPLLLGLGLVSHEFITLALTDKWARSADLLQILCVSGAFLPISNVLSNLLVSKGRSGTFFWCTLVLSVTLIAAMVGCRTYGIRMMAMVYVAIYLVWVFVWHRLVSPLIGYTLPMFLKDMLPFALTALAVMVVTGVATAGITSQWLLLAARIAMAALLYAGVMMAARVRIMQDCIDFVLRRGKATAA